MVGVFSLNLPAALRAINRVSVLKYGLASVARHEFAGQIFSCEAGDPQAFPNPDGSGSYICPFNTGDQVLSVYEFDRSNDRDDLLVVGFITLGYRIIAYATVSWAARQKHFSG